MMSPPPSSDNPLGVYEAFVVMSDTYDAAVDAAIDGEFEKADELEAKAKAKFLDILDDLGWR